MKNEVIGLVIGNGEKHKLKELCLKYNVPIIYEELFNDDYDYHLWGFNEKGIGLISTIIIKNLVVVLHNLNEFEEYLLKK